VNGQHSSAGTSHDKSVDAGRSSTLCIPFIEISEDREIGDTKRAELHQRMTTTPAAEFSSSSQTKLLSRKP
jgi:hypothetical protein